MGFFWGLFLIWFGIIACLWIYVGVRGWQRDRAYHAENMAMAEGVVFEVMSAEPGDVNGDYYHVAYRVGDETFWGDFDEQELADPAAVRERMATSYAERKREGQRRERVRSTMVGARY